jgi:hypothetical protein
MPVMPYIQPMGTASGKTKRAIQIREPKVTSVTQANPSLQEQSAAVI